MGAAAQNRRQIELFPFFARHRIADLEFEGDDIGVVGSDLAFELDVVPVLPAAKGRTFRYDYIASHLCIGARISDQPVRMEIAPPGLDLVHRFKIAQLHNTLAVGEGRKLAAGLPAARIGKRFFDSIVFATIMPDGAFGSAGGSAALSGREGGGEAGSGSTAA